MVHWACRNIFLNFLLKVIDWLVGIINIKEKRKSNNSTATITIQQLHDLRFLFGVPILYKEGESFIGLKSIYTHKTYIASNSCLKALVSSGRLIF